MEENRGITLISLTVTIIILLILAGVTISLVIGNDGILKIAEDATNKYTNAQDVELSDLSKLYSSIIIATGDNAKITISTEDLKKLIQKEVEESKNSISSAPEGTAIILDEKFSGRANKTLTAPEDGWVSINTGATGAGEKWYDLIVGSMEAGGGGGDAWKSFMASLPCKKGQTIMYRVWGSNTNAVLLFIPMK